MFRANHRHGTTQSFDRQTQTDPALMSSRLFRYALQLQLNLIRTREFPVVYQLPPRLSKIKNLFQFRQHFESRRYNTFTFTNKIVYSKLVLFHFLIFYVKSNARFLTIYCCVMQQFSYAYMCGCTTKIN